MKGRWKTIFLLLGICLLSGCDSEIDSKKGYVFIYDETMVEVGSNMALVLETIGNPTSYFEAASCALGGLDKIYTYGSFVIYTHQEGKNDIISAVVFRDDIVTTEEGIGIGDSVKKVKETYGESFKEDLGMIVYKKGDMMLIFILQEDIVVSVEYRSLN